MPLGEDEGITMNTIIADVLRNKTAEMQTDAAPFNIVALFCGLGLLTSLFMACLGLDVSGGIF
jgi:hypothetical protein